MQSQVREGELRLLNEIEKTRLEIREVEIRLQQAIHRQTFWVIGSAGTIIGFIRFLDRMLASLGR